MPNSSAASLSSRPSAQNMRMPASTRPETRNAPSRHVSTASGMPFEIDAVPAKDSSGNSGLPRTLPKPGPASHDISRHLVHRRSPALLSALVAAAGPYSNGHAFASTSGDLTIYRGAGPESCILGRRDRWRTTDSSSWWQIFRSASPGSMPRKWTGRSECRTKVRWRWTAAGS
jgi:hypothetical protein